MSTTPQSYEDHAKMVPLFHGAAFLLLALNLFWSGWELFREPGVDGVVELLFAFGIMLLFWFTRAFPLGVQDRVIRLEERLRMKEVLPDDLKARVGDFTTEQLIGLRFASDGELPELARRVLDDGMQDRKTIKQAVKNWRADHQRI